MASWLVGCSWSSIPAAQPTTGRPAQVAEVPEADETVRGDQDPPIVTLELGSRFRERRLLSTEDLPGAIIVPTTNLNAVPVTTALQAVLAGTDVSLSWDTGSFDNRLVTVTNLSGPLPGVVHKICASAKVFCDYRHGLLELKEKETFIIELPAMPVKAAAGSGASTAAAAANTMADAIGELAGDKAKVDAQGGNLIYTADVEGQDRVRTYLEQLRNGRPLVVLQLYIWEVQLSKENGLGINWSAFKFDKFGGKLQNVLLSGSTAFTSLASPGVSLGATMHGHLDAQSVAQFLSTQGQVQTVSNPQLTFISGSNAEFRVGGKQRYISQVGQLTTSNVSGSNTTNTGIGTNTVSTDSIETGLTVNVGGSFENGVIFAVLDLALQDVVSLNPTTSQGVTIDLPETSERKVSTTLRVRPGDNLVLAGLVSSRDTNDREGIPLPFGGRLPTSAHDQLKNSELVILVKPSVVLFSDSATTREDRQKEKTVEASNKPSDAIVIDKDGTKTLKLPTPVGQPVNLQPTTATAQPELMTAETNPAPIGNVPLAPSEDNAPVDRRLMQRGFSHAFDELLAPASPDSSSTPTRIARP
jgi:Flp pilus assembly secretin CpaC